MEQMSETGWKPIPLALKILSVLFALLSRKSWAPTVASLVFLAIIFWKRGYFVKDD